MTTIYDINDLISNAKKNGDRMIIVDFTGSIQRKMQIVNHFRIKGYFAYPMRKTIHIQW